MPQPRSEPCFKHILLTQDEADQKFRTNPAPFGSLSYVPNTPLATALPIQGIQSGQNIFLLMGQVSPYQPNPVGFGSNEYSLPPGTNISQVHLLSRYVTSRLLLVLTLS
jgi:hypothetical protein